MGLRNAALVTRRERHAPPHLPPSSPSAQLAIAWCLRNERVSTVLLGATSLAQLDENLGALSVVPLLTADVLEQVRRRVANGC